MRLIGSIVLREVAEVTENKGWEGEKMSLAPDSLGLHWPWIQNQDKEDGASPGDVFGAD